jgi:hypothetical protein
LDGGALTNKKPLKEPIIPMSIKVCMSITEVLKRRLKTKRKEKILMEILVVIPSMLSSIFNEFIRPTTQIMVTIASIQNIFVNGRIISPAIKLIPQRI